ncbi:hypothetical protein [Streptomyces longwoodensis]|uniref:hypothetical protein n=1 Tax=Streptomyces longwoodensis TaxID=68231 RepID=UPI0036ECAC74
MMSVKGTSRVPTADSTAVRPAYELLPVVTGAARAEAAALAEDTARQLAEQCVNHPTGQLVDLIRSQATVLGLYEDGVLAGCLVAHPNSDMRHWGAHGRGRGLCVSLIPPVPGRNEQSGRLLTLWLADHAARNGLEWVWWEIPATVTSTKGTTLLNALRDLGWDDLPAVRSTAGEHVVRLRLRAELRGALPAVISAPDTALPRPVVST